MSPASYRAAPPRVGRPQSTRRCGRIRRHPRQPRHTGTRHTRAFPGSRTPPTYSPLVAGGRGVDEAASMLTQPQPVEIQHRGIWYSGELIGWRHEPDGRVAAPGRCPVDGLRHSTWEDLAGLPRPAARAPPRAPRGPAAPPPPTGKPPADPPLPAPNPPPRAERFPSVVRRPVPVVPADEDDATRPHALLGGNRAAKPEHAVVPPAA